MSKPLPKDATFKDLRAPRDNAERFLRKVLGVMARAQKEYGVVVVRMGTTGTGLAPNYRVEQLSGPAILAIDGANHQPWPEGGNFKGPENWSNASMRYQDVEEILRAITGYQGAGRMKR